MKFFSEVLKKSDEYNLIEDNVRQGISPLAVSGLTEPAKAHLAASLCKNLNSDGVVVCESDYDAKKMYENLLFFAGDAVIYYPSKEMEYYTVDAKSNEYINERLTALEQLIYSKDKTIFVLGIDALLQFTVDYEAYVSSVIEIAVGENLKLGTLSEKLTKLGYTHEDMVEGKGQYSIRGGIADVFAPSADNPYRIEFFGDTIDSIREFDAIEQTSIENIERVSISAAAESSFAAAGDKSVISYFNKNALVFLNEPQKISSQAESFLWDINETVKDLIEKEVIAEPKEKYIHDYNDSMEELLSRRAISLSSLLQSSKDFRPKNNLSMTVGAGSSYTGFNEFFFEDLKEWVDKKYKVILIYSGENKLSAISERLAEKGFKTVACDYSTDVLNYGYIYLFKGSLKKGFYYPQLKLCIISDEELFGRAPKRRMRSRKSNAASRINSFTDLSPGDHVVHRVHGIGRYVGLDTLTVDGHKKDYLKIAYKADDFLYVPCDQLELLQKYIGKEGHVSLNKMGGADFAKQKAKVKKSTMELAGELIKIYSARKYQNGFAFSPDTPWQAEFEARFPYEETDDQLRSIEEVKKDMESKSPMDRLLCGDVGYGKTEVALRAAFKAVMDSKQVAYLAPTTVLTMQHYNTFLNRMKDFPISIEMLSRFKTASQQKKILKKLVAGEVDIVIGTHRLLGEDVKFNDLGLLIVDEEQRFGVKHKERIKEIKHSVDVLTLSATPIPRTLHMSMINIKDMSTLTQPPDDRYPVSTIVMEFNFAVVIDAIKREISRGGQVYYLHNRVGSIQTTARRIKEALPDVRVQYAHGQMEEGELEDIMMDMLEGEIDVLVCTTIIETGLDIQNVNTIIIEDADRFGLSQLYQLRGRVGRSNRRAAAYLTYKKNKSLKEDAVKRLSAIKEFTEFGAGFKIAMRDLEIRGAGNILGAEQHGHMDSVGYDMYCSILAESINEIEGKPTLEETVPVIDLPVEAHIPASYIKNHTARLDIYKKIAAVGSQEDYIDVSDEITDRFSDMPKSVLSLLDIALIKALCRDTGISEISVKDTGVLFYLKGDPDFKVLSGLIADYKGRILLSVGQKPYFTLRMAKQEIKDMTPSIKSLLQDLKVLHEG